MGSPIDCYLCANCHAVVPAHWQTVNSSNYSMRSPEIARAITSC
jgi:uncharacterized protein YlaI